jgi:hypothetical protein
VVRRHELMPKRSLLWLGALYLAAAVVGLARERVGAIACGCHEDCWCKRPGPSLFRWVFPFWHKPR